MHEMWEVIFFKHGLERNCVVTLGGGVKPLHTQISAGGIAEVCLLSVTLGL